MAFTTGSISTLPAFDFLQQIPVYILMASPPLMLVGAPGRLDGEIWRTAES